MYEIRSFIKHPSIAHNAIKLTVLFFFTLGFNSACADELTTTKVTDSIHIVNGKGGNIGVFVGADGTYMIDDKFAGMGEDIVSAVKALGGDHPRYLFNTHFHGDHTGSNEHFGSAGSVIVAHHNVRIRLEKGSSIATFNMVTPPAASQALPDITFDSDAAFHINGERVRVYHIPNAHTDGDAIVHFEGSNVIHAGDTFFNGFYPFIDVSNGGSVQGVIDAANSMLALSNDQTLIIPGHGPLAKPDDLMAYRDMLVSANAVLKSLKTEGKSAEQAAAEYPLLNLEEQWGVGMFSSEKWISIVYDSI
ncbi:MAG: cyclase [Candidatus Azotimanducaceae bacterium]|jgi:cyclase